MAYEDAESALRELLASAMAGDASAYHAFLKRLAAHLRAFFRRRLIRLPDEVEDLVQETLLAVHNQRHTYDPGQPITAWIHAIAKYKLIDCLRRRSRRELLTDSIDDDGDSLATVDDHADEARRDIATLLELLPDRQRLPIMHVKLQGLSVIESAQLTGLSVSAVKIGIHRGLKVLAAKIRERQMKTEDLVGMLARGEPSVRPSALGRRYARGLGWGAVGGTLLMAALLGVRPDLSAALRLPMFWVKLVFVAALAIPSLFCVLRLSRPGTRLGSAPSALLAPALAMGLTAALALVQAEPLRARSCFFGQTWNSCPFNIALLSLPAFAGGMWAMKGLAPTRPALAGAAVGLLSGTLGALIYALHCPEHAAPFLAIWYVIGMLVPAAAGAIIGARLLRW